MAKTVIYNSASASTVFDTDNIAVDETTGNLYINDRDNSTIYRIDSNGVISTLLTGHQWNVIKFIGGFLYASKNNGGVYKISITNSTGINPNSTTFVGTSIISMPFATSSSKVNFDSSGNLYLLVGLGNIYKFATNYVSGTTSLTLIVSNNPSSSGKYFSDFKFDGNGNILVLIGYGGNSVTRYSASTANQTSGTIIAGGNGSGSNANKLNSPLGMAIDSSGNIYVADTGNHRIQKFPSNTSQSTNATTVAGTGTLGSGLNQMNSPNSVEIDSSNRIFVMDGNSRIVRYPSNSSSGTSGTIVAGGNGNGTSANQLGTPKDFKIDSNGGLYISDEQNRRVQYWASGATTGTTVAGSAIGNTGIAANLLHNTGGIDLSSDGSIFIASGSFVSQFTVKKFQKGYSTTSLTQITQTSGSNGSATNQLGYPKGFHIFNNNESYVADGVQGRIMYWTSSSSAGTQIASGLSSPMDVTVDSSGNLIVSDQGNHRVLKFTKTATNTFNQSPTVIAGGNGSGSNLNQASPLTVKSNSDGSITVLDASGARVVKWASGSSSGALMSSGYSSITDLYVYGNGDLLISEVGSSGSNTDQKITRDTGLTTAPTMAITSTFSSGATNGASTIALTFTSSLSTSNFTINDITVSGGSLSSFSSTSNTVYTANFTPSGSGSKSISVGSNAYTDTAWGNNNTASNTFTYTHAIPPVISNTAISSNNSIANTRAKVGDVITLTFVSDININTPTVAFTSGGQVITNSVSVSGSNTNWTGTYTVHASDTEGAIGISITATSTAGTQASAYTTLNSGSVTMDKTAPVWSSIAPSGNTSVNTSAVQYTLSEALSSGTVTFNRTGGSAASNVVVSLTGAELNAGTKSLATLTNAPTLVNNAIYSIAFSGVDLYGNTSSTVTQTGVTFNNLLPTITSVTSTTNDGYYNLGDAINITVNFSDAVALIDTEGGSTEMVVTLETGSTDRTVTITSISGDSSASGTYTVQAGDTSPDLSVKTIALGTNDVLSNTAGSMTNFTIGSNLNTTSAIVVDTTAPVISSTSPANSSTIVNKNIGYTLSEQCASGTVVFTRTGGTADSSSPRTVNLVASELTTGPHGPAVLFNNPSLVLGTVYSIVYNVTDLAGNQATAITNSGINYNPDSTAPSVSISSNDVVSGGLSNLETIVIIFSLSEVSTNFAVADITVSGGALSGFSGSGKNYSAIFTPNSNGQKTIDVAVNKFTDAANNNNTAATQFIYTYDGTKPTVAITSTQVNHNATFGGSVIELTFTTSEPTSNFVDSDIVVTNGVLSNFTATSSTVYTALYTAQVNGQCNINVYSDVFTDAANNQNVSSVFTWTKTGTSPTILVTSTISENASTTSNPISLVFTLSTSSSNFVASDVVANGGIISGFSGSGTTYTATYTANATGVQTISVPSNSFTNSGSVGNEEGSFSYTHKAIQLSSGASALPKNFVKRDVLKATITTENNQSSSLSDLDFYYENGVISSDVLPDENILDGLEMIGTQIEIDLDFLDNEVPDVIESVIIGSWMSRGH